MTNLGCPRRMLPALMGIWTLLIPVSVGIAQPVTVSPRWEVAYRPTSGGRPCQSTAVLLDGQSLLVAVVLPGADAATPTLRLGSQMVRCTAIGHDPVSRLGFYKVEGNTAPKPTIWLTEVGDKAAASLQALTPNGAVRCHSTGWVKQVGGKVLPLALLKVRFEREIPPPGSPLTDDHGRVVAMVFQSADEGKTAYAIPSEAVLRVKRDICGSNRKLVRGWLGLTLRAESQSPQIVRVLENSPAAEAGIQPSDILLAIGNRKITDYADAANAFFYLIPEQTVKIHLLRGVDQLEFDVTPTQSAK